MKNHIIKYLLIPSVMLLFSGVFFYVMLDDYFLLLIGLLSFIISLISIFYTKEIEIAHEKIKKN